MTKEGFALSLSAKDTGIIKGVAICLMLWHHLFSNALYSGGSSAVVFMAAVGKVCVSLFLLVSGYGLACQYSQLITDSKNLKERFFSTIKFIAKRYVKFYTGYWVIFLIFVLLGCVVMGVSLESRYETDNVMFPLVVDFFGFMGYHSYNITWWFNRTILLLYFVFPILYLLICKVPYISFTLCLALCLFPIPIAFVNEMTIWMFPFFIGMFWAMKIPQGCTITNKRKYWLLLPIVLILCCGLVYFRQNRIVPYFTGITVDGLLALVFSLIVIILIRDLPIVNVVFSFLGRHSANVYMVHTFLFFYWFPQFIYAPKYAILIFLLLLSCSIGVSMILELIKEKSGIYDLSASIVKKIDMPWIKMI
ncbi:MAG: acyltransferase [Bacteroidales bacterium]|nr:acyltransferase [Bacteroidales bacterium]